MEPEGSLPYSQVPATCPYPEPARSSPQPHLSFWRSILILFSHLCLGHPSALVPSGPLTKTLHVPLLSSPPVTHPNCCVVLCIVCFVLFCVLFVCKCVLYYCHRVTTQLQLINISYHYIMYCIIYIYIYVCVCVCVCVCIIYICLLIQSFYCTVIIYNIF